MQLARLEFWQNVRKPVDGWFQEIPLPKINPDWVSLFSILMSFLFVTAVSQGMYAVSVVFLLIHLFLDGADGAIAKRFKFRKTRVQKQHGMLMDVFADRFSEAIIFLWPGFFWPWFPFFVLNVILGVLSMKYRVSMILPIRQIFAIVFILSLIF